jgi:hypothetical protein
VVFKIVLEFLGECDLRSLGVFELVDKVGVGGHKVSKARVERIVGEGD